MKKYINYKPRQLPILSLQNHYAVVKAGLTFLAILLITTTLIAQPNITRVEYYVDTDPGYGSAKPLTIVAAKDIDGLSFNISLTPLAAGVHIVGVRSKDANGAWSLDNRWLFLKPYPKGSSGAKQNITRVEYYIDNDPGYGNATPLSFVLANNLNNLAINIDLTTLASGVHVVGIRSQDANGAWSLDNRWIFLNPYANGGAVALPDITRVEYYIDTDPGYGNATALPIAPANNFSSLSVNIDLVPLTEGVHIIGIRSQDANGAWSIDNHWVFLKKYNAGKTTPVPKIGRVEYYIDADPGYGKATPIAFTPSANLNNLAINLDITALSQGVHVVGVRSLDSNGAWGLDNHWVFLKPYNANMAAVQPNITQVEYWVDGDPGYGHATQVSISAAQDIADLSFPINISALALGQHKIGVRSKDANGAWSLDNLWAINIISHAGLLKGVSDVSNLKQEALTNNMRLQYNPVHQLAVLLYTSVKNDKAMIRVFDNAGKLVLTKQASVVTGVNPITLETGALAQGIYTIQSVGATDILSVRMLKQ